MRKHELVGTNERLSMTSTQAFVATLSEALGLMAIKVIILRSHA